MAAVNRPTNIKARDANIDSKLQLFGIYNGFKGRKLPTNEQIDVALNSFLESKALKSPHANLSDDGKELVADSREVIRLMKYLFLSKNEDNILQDFIWQTGQFDAKSISGPGAPVDKKTAQQQGDEALEGIRTLGKLLVTNGQFRKLLTDFTVILRDIAGDAASNAAGRVRPSQDQLNQIDLPAEDNTWHESPKFAKGNWKQQMKGMYGGKPKQDAKEAAEAAVAGAQPEDSTRPTGQKAKAGAGNAKSKLQDKFDKNVSPEDKEKIKARNEDYKNRARDYYNKKMPQERRDQTIWRLKKMILECQNHPDYQRAMETLLDLAGEYGRHGSSFAKGSGGTIKQTRSNLQKAQDDLKIIVERFANGTSTDPLWNQIRNLAQSAREDKELSDWFRSLDNYIRRCLLEKGYVLDEASSAEWDQLYDHGRYLLRDKYRGNTNKIIDETRFILDQFDQDPQNKEFGLAVQRLFTHLGQDSSGKSVFKPHLVRDLTDVIIPGFIENVEYIPVPRIEYQDPQFDVVIENLIFEADNLFPNVVEITSNNYFKMGRKKIPNHNNQVFDVRLAGIQMDLRDVNYYFKKKAGFPSLADTGIANLSLSGNGLSFELEVATAQKGDKEHIFKVGKVDCDIRHLRMKLVKSKFKTPFNLLQGVMIKVLRPVIQKVVERVLKKQFAEWDQTAWEIKQDANRTLMASRQDKEAKTPSMYSRYFDSTKKYMNAKKEEQKKKKAGKTSESKVNIAYTMHDSIFPDVILPGATSEKATKYKDLAAQGDRWQSPVFSIGKAGRSTDIPRAPKIQEKTEQKRMFEESLRRNEEAKRNKGTGRNEGTRGGNEGTKWAEGGIGDPNTMAPGGQYNAGGLKQAGHGNDVVGAGAAPQFPQGADSGAAKAQFGNSHYSDMKPVHGGEPVIGGEPVLSGDPVIGQPAISQPAAGQPTLGHPVLGEGFTADAPHTRM